jgi:hypothetical protein
MSARIKESFSFVLINITRRSIPRGHWADNHIGTRNPNSLPTTWGVREPIMFRKKHSGRMNDLTLPPNVTFKNYK